MEQKQNTPSTQLHKASNFPAPHARRTADIGIVLADLLQVISFRSVSHIQTILLRSRLFDILYILFVVNEADN